MASRSKDFDVLVVGAGPAGIAAACCASECGAHVGLLDNNPGIGGQIWRGEGQHPTNAGAREWLTRIAADRIELLASTEVIGHPAPSRLIAQSTAAHNDDTVRKLSYRRLILCTGARELFLPFPGWTLPNVMGAGALQALVKSGLPVAGKKIVVAGSGPLLLAVAAYLREHGGDVRLIAEQAPRHRLARFAVSLALDKAKLAQAFAIRHQLSGIPYKTSCWPVRAVGDEKLEAVSLHSGASTWQQPCDYLACGFHLVPNTELAALLGCELRRGFVRVDQFQRTPVAGVLAAGELTGIGGAEASLVEGQIAGYSAAGRTDRAAALLPQKRRVDRFAALLRRTFALREDLRSLCDPETLICRCEDVEFGRIRDHSSWRASKLHTRCGMGPCQGRICGPITEFLLGWKTESVRPPIFAVTVQGLAIAATQSQSDPVSAKELR